VYVPSIPYDIMLQDPGGAQIGFLLGSLGVSVALTSDMTNKVLPKEEGKDHIVHFRGEADVKLYATLGTW